MTAFGVTQLPRPRPSIPDGDPDLALIRVDGALEGLSRAAAFLSSSEVERDRLRGETLMWAVRAVRAAFDGSPGSPTPVAAVRALLEVAA